MHKKPIIALLGPTATGKTHLALELAGKYPLKIISVDSAMIYKHMNIGTGKPSTTELAHVPHALIDILDPNESYSAADFRKDALQCIEMSHKENKIPLLVGGTMLYFNALMKGLAVLPKADIHIRRQLQSELENHGLKKMHARLCKVDPNAAAHIYPNDPQRVLRALEVYAITGQPITSLWQAQPLLSEKYSILEVGIFPHDRDKLHTDIAKRFQHMLQVGFVDEVSRLRARADLSLNCPSMRAVGYRQIWQYLEGEFDYDSMQENALAATRQLAKRQMTWLRQWQDIQYVTECKAGAKLIQKFVLGTH